MRFDRAFPARLFSLVFQAAVLLLFFSACSGDPTAPNRPLSLDAAIGTDPTTGATVETDKDDYFPGDQVQITGSGWAPGETVDFHLTREPKTSDDTDWTVTADENGRFTTGFLVVESDLGVTFTLTGSGPTSGSVVTVVFTDNIPPGQITITLDGNAAVNVAPGALIELAVTARVSTAGNPTAWNSTGWVLTLSTTTPAGKLTNCVDTDNAPGTASSGTEYSDTLNITAPPNPGTYHLWLALDQDDGTGVNACGGPGGQSVKKIFESVVTVEEPDNEAPTADAGAYPDGGDEGTSIQLDGSGSSDGEGGIASYQWSIVSFDNPDGGTCTFDGEPHPANVTTGVSPSVTCDDNGTLTVSLVVTDEDDLASAPDQATIIVANVNPTVVISPNDQTINEGGSAAYTATVTDPGSNDTHTVFSWTSTIGACTPDAGATITAATFTCTDNGTGTVKLEVEDDDDGPGDDTAELTVNNVAPEADALATNTPVNEGSNITLSLTNPSDVSSVDEASLRYAFDCGSGYGTAVNYATASPTNSGTCPTNDDGSRLVKGKVFDKDGGSNEYTANVTINNVAPQATFNSPSADVPEGTAFTLSLSDFVEPSSEDLNAGLHFAFDCGDPATPVTLPTTYLAAGTASSISCPTADNATRTVKARIFDKDDGYTDYSGTVNVVNVAPSVALTNPTIAGSLFNLLNGPIPVSATYSDVPADTHECELELVGTKSVTVPYFAVSGSNCSNPISAPEAGVYTLIVRVKDDDGGVGTASLMIVVYDPSAGFVTGGGWIYSERGAYKADTYLEGKATFGFVSKYKKGATIPEGNTEFVFHAGGMNFHSTSYQFLLVNQAGTNAQFKGVGKINGLGSYTFMIWATDGGSGYDTFRIQLTDNNNGGAVVYDNGVEQSITGSIVIHTGKK